jgi:hypothetical protein
MIYHRIIPENENPQDSITGFGIDSDHYIKVRRARQDYNEANPDTPLPTHKDYTQRYDIRSGYYIDGSEIVTRKHKYHDYHLVHKETGDKYHIDMVCIDHYYGSFLSFTVRKFGSKSHGQRVWEINTCKDPDTIRSCNKSRSEYDLIKTKKSDLI